MAKRKNEGYNPYLKALILQVVDNQINGVDETGQPIKTVITEAPEYVKDNFERLSLIHGSAKAKEMIAAVMLGHMYDVLKYNRTFDERQYKSDLERLN